MKKYMIFALVGVIGFVLGNILKSKQVEVREVEKIVYKERTDKKSNIQRDVNKKETIKPDGTKIIETTTSTTRNSEVKSEVSNESEKSKITKATSNWHISVLYSPSVLGYQTETYTLDLQRRLMGDLFVGVSGSTQKQFSISIGLEL